MPVTCPRCSKQFKRHFGSHVWVCDVTLEELFWVRVEKTPTCWLWTGAKRWDGYGRWNLPGRQMTTHRYSWELANGTLAAGIQVLHKCDTPACVRPDHLFLGTVQANSADKVAKRRHTFGERNGRARITDAVAAQLIAEMTGAKGEQRALARKYGIPEGLVQAIAAGRLWKHLPRPHRPDSSVRGQRSK